MHLAWKDQNFLQFFVLVFLLIFCVVKSVNGLKKTQKVEFSLLSWFCGFFTFFAWFSLTPGTKGAGWLLFMQSKVFL